MPALQGVLNRFGLMGVQLRHAARFERGPQPRIERLGERRIAGGDGWEAAERGDVDVWAVWTIGQQPGRQSIERRVECRIERPVTTRTRCQPAAAHCGLRW